MTILTALLPHKHIRFADSLLALAGIIREKVKEPKSIDEILTMLDSKKTLATKIDITQISFALIILFSIQQINIAPEGRVVAVKS